jgi:predicted flap endonuclease-1-like 5' DNA nuclease
LVARAAIDGIARGQGSAGVDIGADAGAPIEPNLAPESPAETAGDGAPGAKGDAEVEPLFERPAGPPDNLRRIPGVGKVLEGRLHALGVTKFDQIAAMSPDDVARLDEALNSKGRIERDDWVGQARGLIEAVPQ